MYLKLNEYRWWVGLWSNADGNLHTEIPNVHLDYYSDITKVGDQLQIREGGQPVGNFSKLSKVIQLKTYKGFFDSKCEVIEN